MKSVMLSIQPKWCEKIANGEKTVEVRKTCPKLEPPFKCYIYMTKNGNKPIEVIETDKGVACLVKDYKMVGKIIGEFVCDKITEYECSSDGHTELATTCGVCLTFDEILNYCNGYELYGLHISDLKIYDTPRELGEFRYYVDCENVTKRCSKCKYSSRECNGFLYCNNKITHPPQSWCYVE